MQTSGLVLDIYDDKGNGGAQMREMFPSLESVPSLLKTASFYSPEDLAKLPDESFALVLDTGEKTLRKYACTDAGSTAMSAVYLVKNAHKLPEEAQKVAAQNLLIACDWYGLDKPRELLKMATVGDLLGSAAVVKSMAKPLMSGNLVGAAGAGLGRAQQIAQIKGTSAEIGRNMRALGRLERNSPSTGVYTPGEINAFKTASAKMADITGTEDMPVTPPDPKKPVTDKYLRKNGSEVVVSSAPNAKEELPPQTHFKPHVSVKADPAPKKMEVKVASRYALENMYPLDTYNDVLAAAGYFDKYASYLAEDERRKFGSNVYNRALEIGVEERMPEMVRVYGSDKYASASHISMGMQYRRTLLNDPIMVETFDKVAKYQGTLPPLEFAELIADFDKVAGLVPMYQNGLSTPQQTVYERVKTASEEVHEFSDTINGVYINGNRLAVFSREHRNHIQKVFGPDFAKEFAQDPISIYKSLPTEQKIMMARMANESVNGQVA